MSVLSILLFSFFFLSFFLFFLSLFVCLIVLFSISTLLLYFSVIIILYKTTWPSGLRRVTRNHFSYGGVGSNPAVVAFQLMYNRHTSILHTPSSYLTSSFPFILLVICLSNCLNDIFCCFVLFCFLSFLFFTFFSSLVYLFIYLFLPSPLFKVSLLLVIVRRLCS